MKRAAETAVVVLTTTSEVAAPTPVEAAASFELGDLLGQSRMASAIGKLSMTLGVSKLAEIKASRAYKALKGQKSPTGRGLLSGTWDEFCTLNGRSVSQVDEDIANLKAFGEDALKSLDAIGAGYREMSQFRRLPEDEKQALIEAAKSGDKDTFLDLAEEIVARSAAAKQLAAERIKELERRDVNLTTQLGAADGLLAAANKRIKRLEGQRDDGVPAVLASLRSEVLVMQKKALLAIEGLRAAATDLTQLLGSNTDHAMADATLRLGAAGIVAIGLQLQGALQQYEAAAPGLDAELPQMANLKPQEQEEVAARWRIAANVDALERLQSVTERHNNRPNKGKGRDRKIPTELRGRKA